MINLEMLGFRWWPAPRIPGMAQWDATQLPPGWRTVHFQRYFFENGGGHETRVDFINPEGFPRARMISTITMSYVRTISVKIFTPNDAEWTDLQVDPLPEWRALQAQCQATAVQIGRCWNRVQELVSQHPHLYFQSPPNLSQGFPR